MSLWYPWMKFWLWMFDGSPSIWYGHSISLARMTQSAEIANSLAIYRTNITRWLAISDNDLCGADFTLYHAPQLVKQAQSSCGSQRIRKPYYWSDRSSTSYGGTIQVSSQFCHCALVSLDWCHSGNFAPIWCGSRLEIKKTVHPRPSLWCFDNCFPTRFITNVCLHVRKKLILMPAEQKE